MIQDYSGPRCPVACPRDPEDPAKTVDPVHKPRGVGKDVIKRQNKVRDPRKWQCAWLRSSLTLFWILYTSPMIQDYSGSQRPVACARDPEDPVNKQRGVGKDIIKRQHFVRDDVQGHLKFN